MLAQALVKYCAGEGKPEAVEAAVMHMDIASLDLNQVIRLCRQHGLFSALAFLYPRALLDFVAAAAELLVALVHAPAAANAQERGAGSMQQALADKLLVYLRCCFRGQKFPPGAYDPAFTGMGCLTISAGQKCRLDSHQSILQHRASANLAGAFCCNLSPARMQ